MVGKVAGTLLLFAALGCSNPERPPALVRATVAAETGSAPVPQPPVVAAAPASATAAGPGNVGNRVKLSELKLDFHLGSVGPPQVLGGVMGDLTWSNFAQRWAQAAEPYGGTAISLRQDGPVERGYHYVSAQISPNIVLRSMVVGNDAIHSLVVKVFPYDKRLDASALRAWETAIDTVSPWTVADDHRRIYAALGLTVQVWGTRSAIYGQRVYQFDVNRVNGELELTLTIEPALETMAPGWPTSVYVPFGQLGDQTFETFVAVMPKTFGQTFQDALRGCQAQGLDLCTDLEWRRTCQLAPELIKLESWTSSFDASYRELQWRGGGSDCNDGGQALSSKSKATRGGLCCTRAIALSSWLPPAREASHPLLALERGLNQRNQGLISTALVPLVDRYEGLSDAPRDRLLERILPAPYTYSLLDSCQHTPADSTGISLMRCTRTAFSSNEASVTRMEYGVRPDGVASAQGIAVLRKRATF